MKLSLITASSITPLSLVLVVIAFIILLSITTVAQNSGAINDNKTYRFIKLWGGEGSDDGQFILPHSLAVDKYGNIFVTDTGNNRVEKFSRNGTFISKWGSEGASNGQFLQLHDINVSPDGKFIYTAELGNHRVQKFTSNGTFVTKWG